MSQITIPQAENINVSELKTDQQNPNKMSKEQHERLATSIKKWGFIVPIITNKDLLIADGEQRWTVAKSLGMTQVSVIRLPVEDVDRRLLRQVLNKLRGEHELLLDAEEFDKIIELGRKDDLKYLLDLTDKDLEKYLKELHPTEEDNYQIPTLETVITTIIAGDIIQLGKHRLMCGDSTDKGQILTLTEYSHPDLLLTDPPYANFKVVDDEGFVTGKPTSKNLADKTKYIPFVNEANFTSEQLKPLLDLCSRTVVWGGNYFELEPTNSWLIWDKRAGVGGYGSDCEMAWSNLGCKARIYSFTWQGMIRSGEKEQRVHPTQKPPQLSNWILNELCPDSKTILDLFGGSGSTLIACEQTGRVCYMMEIDPRYCEIIAARWEKYTGQKRVKLVTSGKNNV
jgi:DNA modification methylase